MDEEINYCHDCNREISSSEYPNHNGDHWITTKEINQEDQMIKKINAVCLKTAIAVKGKKISGFRGGQMDIVAQISEITGIQSKIKEQMTKEEKKC